MSPPDMITISTNDGQATMNNAYDDSFDENEEVDNGDGDGHGLLGQRRQNNNNDKDDEKKGKKVAAEVLLSGLNLNDSSSEKERERERAEAEEFYRDQEYDNSSSNNNIDTTGNLCWTLYRQANQVRRFQDKSMKLMGIIESLQKENTSLLEQVQNLQTQLKLLMNENQKTNKKLKKSKHNNKNNSESALFYGVCDESSFDSEDSDDSENYNFGSTNTNTSDDDDESSSCMSSLSSDEGHSRSAPRSLTSKRNRRESLGDQLTNLRVDLERDESQFFKSEVERLNQLRQRDQSNFERENKKLLEKISTMEKEMSAHYKAHYEDQLRKQKSLYEKKIKEILLQQQTQKQKQSTTTNNEPKSIMKRGRSRSSSIEATSKGGVLPPFIFSNLTIESSLQLHDFWINDTLLFEREGDTNNDISTKEKFIATASLDKTIKITSLLQNNINEKDNKNQNNKNNNENQNTVFTVVKTIKAHKHRVMSIVMTEIDGQNVIASASWDKTIRFWNCTNTRNTFNHIATLKTSEKAHRLVPFFLQQQHHPQQQSQSILQQSSHSGKSSAAHASGGKHMLACALYNGTIEIWDVQAFRKVEMLSHGHSHCIMALDVFEYKSILYLVSGDIMKKLNVWRGLSSPLDPHKNKKNNDDGWGVSKKKNNNHKLIKTLSKRGGITSVCTFPFYMDDEEEDEQDEGGSTSHCKDVIIAACKKRDVVLYRMSNYEVYHRFDFEKDCIFAIKPFVIQGGAGVKSGTRRRMLATTSDKGWLRVIDVKKKTLVYKFQCDDLRFSFLYLLNDCHNVITKKTTTTRRRSSIDKNHKRDSKQQQQLKHQDVVFVSGGKDKQTEKGTLVMLKMN